MLTDFAGDHAAYQAWLGVVTGRTTNAYRRRVVANILTLDHDVVADVTPLFLGGEMVIDVDNDPSRAARVELLDPGRSLAFEPDSPSSLPLHFSRMLRLGMSTYVPALGEWVTCPIFCGPIADFDRDGVIATISAHGKEALALGQAGRSITIPKKTKKVEAIRMLLRAAGETRFNLPDGDSDVTRASLPERVTVRSDDAIWPAAVKIARSMDRHLFYDARGVATLRSAPGKPSLTFNTSLLASEVAVDRDPSGIRNRWIVTGAKPKGAKQRVRADLKLPTANPLSAQSLGRTVGEQRMPRWLIERVDNSGIKTSKEAYARARRLRDDSLRAPEAVSFDTLPLPHLEEMDLVRALDDVGAWQVRVKQLTLPLGIDGAPPMSIGAIKRTSVPSGRLSTPSGRRVWASRPLTLRRGPA